MLQISNKRREVVARSSFKRTHDLCINLLSSYGNNFCLGCQRRVTRKLHLDKKLSSLKMSQSRLMLKKCHEKDQHSASIQDLTRLSCSALSEIPSDKRKKMQFVKCCKKALNAYPNRVNSVAALLRKADIKVLQADKEGAFVIVPRHVYDKAELAISGNFKELSDVSPAKVKSKAAKLCDEAGLSAVRHACQGKKRIEPVCTAKTQKEGYPFREIVSERGNWQCLVGSYL